MRKVLISTAVAVSALAFAAPAAAQYHPARSSGHAYGYNNPGHVRGLQARLDNLQRQIKHLDKRDVLSEREAGSLREQSRQIERQLRYSSRNGLNPKEANSIERRIARLEQRVSYEARDGNRYAGRGRY
jgi:predicted RNase H-like nuclease (RuvC/YqgF family)